MVRRVRIFVIEYHVLVGRRIAEKPGKQVFPGTTRSGKGVEESCSGPLIYSKY
jgi:hypothetical protein